jgi:AcrR family transcriptional regulator
VSVKRLRVRQAEATRSLLLEVARENFTRHGYAATSIDDIIREAGVARGALYHHFSGKEDMLVGALTPVSEELLAGGQARVERAGSPAETLADLVRFQVDFALDKPALITVQERNLGNLTDPDRRRVRALQRRYVEVWVDAIRTAMPGTGEPAARAAAHAVFGLINSTPHSRHLDREAMGELLRGMALAALTSRTISPDGATQVAAVNTR